MKMMTRRSLAVTVLSALGPSRLRAADVPRKAPDFDITLPNGSTVKLSDYKGKVVAFACILTT
jgi:hypothetical protein